jgi:hypothetical protein
MEQRDLSRSAATSSVKANHRGSPQTRFKDDLRRRCLARLAQKRSSLVEHRRDMQLSSQLRGIIAEELRQDSIPRSIRPQPSAWTEADEARLRESLGDDGYAELMSATEEALLQELQQDISLLGDGGLAATQEEYEQFLAAEEEQLRLACEEARMLESASSMSSGEAVLCPLCARVPVHLDSEGWVACTASCGLRLDARGAPSSPVELLRDRMCTLLTEHGRSCTGMAFCRMTLPTEAHFGRLLFCCEQCRVCSGVV